MKPDLRPFLLACILLVLVPMTALAAPPERPGPKDRCPVCGMFVAPYHNWMSVAVSSSGARYYFDGPKDMFRFLSDQKTYRPKADAGNPLQLWVTEYYSTRLVKAEDVFFVVGSDVNGPMGPELVPIAGKDAAETFLRDHGGRSIMMFDGQQLQKVTGE